MGKMKQPIRVYVIHRFQILLDVLAESMRDCPEVLVVGAATGTGEAASALEHHEVDVLLIDPILFGSTASRSIRELKKWQPQLKIVPLGLVTNDQIVEQIEAGASGYISEKASFDQLIETIRGVYHDQAPCSSQVAASISARMVQLSGDHACQEPVHLPQDVKLTPKEAQVLKLAAQGMSNKEIASKLNIALSTAKIHIHRILGKLSVKKRREAIQLAYETGLLPHTTATVPLDPARD